MKYQSRNTSIIYDLHFTTAKMYKCPECSDSRKKQNKKDLQYYSETKTAHCFHCETTFFEYKPYDKKEYIAPKWENVTKLTDKAVKYFTSRMISQNTLNELKVYSSSEWMPQFKKEIECICFPYFRDNSLVNIKYRGANKAFKLYSGAELIWYNFDALKNNKEIIICEGEIDLLSWWENGYKNVISVPNGAGNNLQYLDDSIKLFDDIDKIYLSTDTDTKGIELRDELIRRLGAEKCHLINFKQFKDANAYFVGLGGLEFKKLIKESKQAPIKGIVKIDSLYNEIIDLYENGEQPGFNINCPLDELVTWELGRLAIITGVPGSGKSEFVDYVVSKLNLLYDWKAAYFTPENYPLKYHYRKLHSKLSGLKFEKKSDNTNFLNIYEYLKDNYYYILEEQDMAVNTVMESAKQLVKQKGIKILVIDPYNKLEHQQQKGQSETQYISKFLDVITNFARFNNILVFLVAHPRKMLRGEIPNLYDISGSANFYNKTDYGITVHRKRNDNGAMINEVDIYVQKVKFKHLGEQGQKEFSYNYNNGRFDYAGWDNNNWLLRKQQPKDNEINFDDVQDIDPF
jgi:twinkle protein